jgi:hypothetical protein
MKYTIKVEINNQVNVNEGQVDESNNPLPPQIEVIPSYKIITNVNNEGSVKLTVGEIKTQLRNKFSLTNLVEEKLFANKQELTNDGDEVSSFKLEYKVISPQTNI